jgi:hypothetical protein
MLSRAPVRSVRMLAGPLLPRPIMSPAKVASAALQLVPPPSMPSTKVKDFPPQLIIPIKYQ